MQDSLNSAKEVLANADAVLFLAGAGMSADSGLSTYRGSSAPSQSEYVLSKLGLQYEEIASFKYFRRNPKQALGFYGERLEEYLATEPHSGYRVLKEWSENLKHFFVATTNVDGAFLSAGFEPQAVWEMHGSIFHWQCRSLVCSQDNGLHPIPEIRYNPKTLKAKKIPKCPICKSELRPNVMMFNDGGWDETRARDQEKRCRDFLWLENYPGVNLVVLEIGAGEGVPKLRKWSERIAQNSNRTVIRINPEPDTYRSEGIINIRMGAKDALSSLLKD